MSEWMQQSKLYESDNRGDVFLRRISRWLPRTGSSNNLTNFSDNDVIQNAKTGSTSGD